MIIAKEKKNKSSIYINSINIISNNIIDNRIEMEITRKSKKIKIIR